ncbi:MAG: hypothetical protein IJK92_08215 [Bacteroidales bacterium]|nr:hypothetical protein [Bacteroidales bacterium]
MRKILIIAMALLLPVCAVAQKKGYKLAEANPSEKPKWVTEKERPDYIYVKGQEGANLADAKAAAMKVVVDDISQSVAVMVEGEIIDKTVMNVYGDKSEFKQEYINNTKTKLAKMPAIQGIAIQKADVYYERYYCKKTGAEYYMVYIRYPFSEFERRDLIAAYNAHEKEIDDKIKLYEDEVETVGSIEDISKNISLLGGLKSELGEDDSRIHKINTIIGLYNDIYKSIMVEVVENRPGHMAVRLVYKGRVMTTSQKPNVSSSCAMGFDVRYSDGVCNVDFDSEYCYPQDEPTVKISFRAGNSRPNKEIRIKF